MPLFIATGSKEDAFEVERQIHAAADRIVATDVHGSIVDIMCEPGEEEELLQVLTKAGIREIMEM